MKAGFSMITVNKVIDDFVNDKIKLSIEVLAYIGENFVNEARESGNYTDRTGNLRSSIGYVVVVDNKIVKKEIKSAGKQGNLAKETIANALNEIGKGVALIGFAGMEYAAYVESRGYDVITNSVPTSNALLNEIKKVVNAN